MKKKLLIVAHPDDEIIFFPAHQMDLIIIVFEGRKDKPQVAEGRSIVRKLHLFKEKILYLRIKEPGYWKEPTKVVYPFREKNMLKTLLDEMKEPLSKYDIYTHNAEGEYGHFDHILVHDVVLNVFSQRTNIFMPSTKTSYHHSIDSDDKSNYEMKSIYEKYNCWTWEKDFIFPKTYYFDKCEAKRLKIASLASVPVRISFLKDTLASIYDQFDYIHVYLNSYDKIPEYLFNRKIFIHGWNQKDLGDSGKFYPVSQYDDAYFFTLDDDIIYPKEYTLKMIQALEKWGEDAVICVHANVILKPIVKSYYKEKVSLSLKRELLRDTRADIPGTGSMLIIPSKHDFDLSLFAAPNMADVWMFKYTVLFHKKVIAIRRKKNWLWEQKSIAFQNTVYEQCKNNDELQTYIVNKYWRKGNRKK